jgi:hypothetical protein
MEDLGFTEPWLVVDIRVSSTPSYATPFDDDPSGSR